MKTFLIGICIAVAAIGLLSSVPAALSGLEKHPFQVSAVDSDHPDFNKQNGVLYNGETPFTGQVVAQHKNGNKASASHYVHGRMHGSSKEWYPNGQLASNRTYKHGKKEGLHLGWWEDGTPRFEFNFLDGVYEGSVKEWSKIGRLVKEFNYHEGKEEGAQKMWTDEGKIKANYVMINGRRYGYIGSKNCVSTNEDS